MNCCHTSAVQESTLQSALRLVGRTNMDVKGIRCNTRNASNATQGPEILYRSMTQNFLHISAAYLPSCSWKSLTRANAPHWAASDGLLCQKWISNVLKSTTRDSMPLGHYWLFMHSLVHNRPSRSTCQAHGIGPKPTHAFKLSPGSASTQFAFCLAWQGTLTFQQTAVRMSAGPDPPSRPYTAESATSSRPVTRGDDSSAGSRPMTPTQRLQQEMAATQRKRLQRLQVSNTMSFQHYYRKCQI